MPKNVVKNLISLCTKMVVCNHYVGYAVSPGIYFSFKMAVFCNISSCGKLMHV